MNKKIIFGLIVAVIVIGLIIMGVGRDEKNEEGSLKIGALYALSGPAAVFGEISIQGVKDALHFFEEETGHDVQLIIEDTANDPKIGVSAANKLFNVDNVKFAVVGTSGITNAVSPLAEENKVVLITDAAGYGLTKNKTYLFQNLLPSLNNIPEQINNNPKWSKIAIVNINDEFGNLWKDEWLEKISQSKTTDVFTFDKSITDFRTDVAKIKSFAPDVVAVVGYGPSLNQVLADISVQGVDAPIISYLACTLPGVLSDERFNLDNNYSYEYPEYQNSEIKDWIIEKGGSNSTFYGLAFENTLAALYAMKETNNDPDEALNYLKTQRTNGVFGDLIFNQDNVIERELEMKMIVDGKCVK